MNESQLQYTDDPSVIDTIHCVFYPEMDCTVQEALEKATIGDKLVVTPKDNPFGVITTMSPRTQRFMVLASYCGICPYKAGKDWEADINKKIQLADKFGPDTDSELQIMRVPKRP